MNENMNSSRPLIDQNQSDDKNKNLSERNEKLEKELLKLQIQNKTLEEKLKQKNEKEYQVNLT